MVTQIGVRFEAPPVVLTAGTFPQRRVHVGLHELPRDRGAIPGDLARPARLKELALPQGAG